MISIAGLYKRFKRNEVLKGVTVEFEPGITAILGPNGSGKTTLIKCIMGMVIPDRGVVKVGGRVIDRKGAYRSKISYLPQIARFPENLKVREVIALVSDIRGLSGGHNTLATYFDLDIYWDQPLSSLSGGTLQKVNLVMALMSDNDTILLDEPTSGLDPVSMQRLRSYISNQKEQGKTLLLTTHIMSFAEEMADRIIYLLDGVVFFDGLIADLKQQYGKPTLEGAIAEVLKARKVHSNGQLKLPLIPEKKTVP